MSLAFRDGPLGDRRLPLGWSAAAAVVLALLVALGLLLTDRRESGGPAGYGAPRSQFDELLQPVTGVLAAPVRWVGEAVTYVQGYFLAAEENRQLKREIAELQRYKDAAIALKSINDQYEALLKLRTEPPIPSVAARVIADARGPFSNARLADAGAERGVKVGNPVLSQHGVVGRIVGVTQGASRILLLTDVDARTPVVVDRTNARGILVGDGGPYPRIEYVRGKDPVRPGDVLLTSGDGGVFPRGLPVGVVSKDLRGQWRARLYADSAPIEYVRILAYQDFAASLDPASLKPGAVVPLLTPDERKSLQAALAPPPPKPAAAPAPGASPSAAATAGPTAPPQAKPAGPPAPDMAPARPAREAAAPPKRPVARASVEEHSARKPVHKPTGRSRQEGAAAEPARGKPKSKAAPAKAPSAKPPAAKPKRRPTSPAEFDGLL